MSGRQILLTLGLMIGVAACQESTLKTGIRGGPDGALAVKYCDVALTYANVKPIFENRCQRCHQPGSRNGVGSYNEVFRIKDSIHFEVSNDTMPDDGPLATDQKELMMAWLNAGAPETSSQIHPCAQTPEKKPDPPPPVVVNPPPVVNPPAPGPRTYTELRAKVLVPKCLNCHSLDGSAMLYDFTDYKSMIALTDIFDTANAANSVIVQAVLKQGRGQMPPVRSNIPRLTPDEVELLRGWIEDGLLE